MFAKKDFKTKLNDEFKSDFKKDLMKLDIETLTSITENLDGMRDILIKANELNNKFKENPSLNKEELLKSFQEESKEFETNLSEADREKLKSNIKKQLFVLGGSAGGVFLAGAILSPAAFLEIFIGYIGANIIFSGINRYKKSKLADSIVNNIQLKFTEKGDLETIKEKEAV